MFRAIVYPSSIPQDTDILSTNKHAMIGVGSVLQSAIGSGINVFGLACTPTSPPTLSVNFGQGGIVTPTTIDTTAYGSLGVDTNFIVKAGLKQLTNIAISPPSVTGQSQIFLLQVSFQEVDANPIVLPYYNASNPSQGFSGPFGTGTAQNTTRQDLVNVVLKPGTPATSPTPPAPDTGFTGLYLITLAAGATSIVTGNITRYSGAPFIDYPLSALQYVPGAITALQSSSGGSQAALGYVPVNKAGDSMSGPLTLNSNLTVSGNITEAGYNVWHAGNLTNLNQLSNGPGYLTNSNLTATSINNALGYRPLSSVSDTATGSLTVNGTMNAGNVQIGGVNVSTQTDAQNRANTAQTNAINTAYSNSATQASAAQTNAQSYAFNNFLSLGGGNLTGGLKVAGVVSTTSGNGLTSGANIWAGWNNGAAVYGGYVTKNGASGGFGGNTGNFWYDTVAGRAYIFIDNSYSLLPVLASDGNFKHSIEPLDSGALDRINQLRPIKHRWLDKNLFVDDKKDHHSLIAQEVKQIIPEAVVDPLDEHGHHSIDLLPLLSHLILAVQELSAKVNKLEGIK
jgi:hypothetical protein